MLDAARFAARRWQDGRTPSRIRLEAFRSFILPQLEGSDDDDARHLFEVLADVFDPPELHELRRTVRAMTRTTAHPVPSEPGRPQAVAG